MQSAGVPSMAKAPSSTFRRRSGRWRLRAWLAALCSVSGAMTMTSYRSRSASRMMWRPGLAMPSSFERSASARGAFIARGR